MLGTCVFALIVVYQDQDLVTGLGTGAFVVCCVRRGLGTLGVPIINASRCEALLPGLELGFLLRFVYVKALEL